MDDSASNLAPTGPSEVRPSEAIYRHASAIMLKLLDRVERDIAEGKLPSPHLEAYEVLCRAEQVRTV